jgi:hypothetical protein
VEDFLDEEGIKHEFCPPIPLNKMRWSKKKNQTLVEMARTMLDEYKTLD